MTAIIKTTRRTESQANKYISSSIINDLYALHVLIRRTVKDQTFMSKYKNYLTTAS